MPYIKIGFTSFLWSTNFILLYPNSPFLAYTSAMCPCIAYCFTCDHYRRYIMGAGAALLPISIALVFIQ